VALPRISVIVPTYNRSQHLMRALRAFREDSLPAEKFEIIVADDGSSDGTEALVRSFMAEYRIKYHFQEDLGFRPSAARNAAAKLADGDVLAFFDAGQLPGPSFAASHLSAHTRLPGLHSALVGMVYGYDQSGLTPYATRANELSAERLYRSIPKESDPRYATFARLGFDLRRLPLPPLLFWAGNCSVRTEDFWDVGGFDESYTEWGMEDVDLAYRLWDRGTTFAVCQDGWAIELYHHQRDWGANFQSLARNIEKFLQDCGPLTPAREILTMLLPVSPSASFELQDHYRALIEWEIAAKDVDVRQEVQDFCREQSGKRLAIIGIGAAVPEPGTNVTLFDFDQQFSRTTSLPNRSVRHRIGMRTGLPDDSVDSLLITSRLRGVWGRLCTAIMNEAKRVARDVRLGWS
jgi:GT2 family glycosyltransferase